MAERLLLRTLTALDLGVPLLHHALFLIDLFVRPSSLAQYLPDNFILRCGILHWLLIFCPCKVLFHVTVLFTQNPCADFGVSIAS